MGQACRARRRCSGRQPSPLRLLEAITPKTFAGSVAQVLNPAAKRMPSEAVIDWSVAWDRGMTSTLLTGATDDRAVLSSLPTSPLLVIGSLNNRDERDADLFHTPAAFLRAEPVWGGATAAMPGVIAQVVLAQSLATGHWLTPLSDVACVALAAGLGIMTAALLPGRGQRLRLLGIGLPLAGLAGLQVAVGAGILIPLALPSVAFASSCLLRRES